MNREPEGHRLLDLSGATRWALGSAPWARGFAAALVLSSALTLLLFSAASTQAATGMTITATEGQPFSGQVADFTSFACGISGVSVDEATIVWGDHPSTAGVVQTDLKSTGLSVSGTHTYVAAGIYEGSVKVDYKCNGVPFSVTATFTAQVKSAPLETPPTETTPTTPTMTTPAPSPPPPPPVARATFTPVSLAPGRAVLNAAASVPPGTSVTHYSWNITGGAAPDVVCQGSQPQLTVMTHSALHTTIGLTATDAQGATTTAQQTLDIPAPAIPISAIHGSHIARDGSHSARAAAIVGARRVIGTAVTPAFTVLGECAASTPRTILAPLSAKGEALTGSHHLLNVGGAPPAECNQNVVFGAADVLGCLEPIAEPNELPGGITRALAGLLCGSHDESFCAPALSEATDAGASFIEDEVSAAAADTATAKRASILERAVPGLLKGLGFPSYYSWDPVRIDGLDIDPRNGQPILVIPSASVVVSADASIYLHGIPISPIHTVALYLPAAGGHLGELSLPHKVPIIGSLPFTGSVSVDLHRAGSTLPNGDRCAYDCAAISVNAELPGVFSDDEGHGLSAGAVITADDQEGLELDSLEVKIPHADLAGIGVDNVDFRYRRGDDSLRGQATLDLLASGEITASFAFVHGSFQEAHVDWDAGDGPGIDLGGPFPIFLTRLGGGVSLNPTTISAEGSIAGGGHVLGCSLFGINGKLTIQFAPFDLQANATGELLCQQVAEEYFHVDEAGDVGVGGKVSLSIYVLSFSAAVDFEVSQGHVQFDGNIQACLHLLTEPCLSAEVVISDHGLGACADFGFTHAGAGIVFPDSFKFMLDSCDIAQFRSLPMPANLSSVSHRATTSLGGFPGPTAFGAQALPSFTVPHGQSVAVVGVAGQGGAPNVTLRGPDGRTIQTPAAGYLKDANEVVIADGSKTMETYFLINHPAPGRWQIVSNPGSMPVAAVQQAAALPSPNLHAKVSRAGAGKERLRYSLRSIPGQQVSFVDGRKGQGFRVLGQAHGSHGAITFTPSSALGRRHEIVAWVTQGGQPREDVTLAHYAAPAPPRLAAPRGLRLKRHGATVAVSWHAVPGAAAYTLTVGLSGGGQQHYVLGAQSHGATLSIPSYKGASVSVAAQAPGKTHRAGRRAKAKLRPGPRPRGVAIKPFVA
jgi:hypothetical protein